MESAVEQKNSARELALTRWLQIDCGLPQWTIHPMVGDASFRRYFRIITPDRSYVVMDALLPQENTVAYVAIAKTLRRIGLNAPEIIHADLTQGFLLITDFGDFTYLKVLNASNANQLYTIALTALSEMQVLREAPGILLPPFTHDFMCQEWAWHKEWFLHKCLGLDEANDFTALDDCYLRLVASAVNQPQVFMHRDYHSANVMMLPENGIGILDFQDAFIGPVTYDIASLLRDCYIDWPEAQVTAWVSQYLHMLQAKGQLSAVSEKEFLYWFDLMSMQRHLKALLTFGRKHVRDHQSAYLKHVPRTLNYLLKVSARYPEFACLHDYLQKSVLPASKRVMLTCVQ